MKDKKIIFGITLAFLFLASVGFSCAYFTSTITNKDVKNQIVETGTLSLRYVDKTYARIDGGTSSPEYFTLKTN